MKVESGTHYLNINQRTQISSNKASVPFADFMAQEAKDTAASTSTNTPSSKVETYDFTSMTPREIHEAVGKLVRSGQIDGDQFTAMLSLTSSLSPLSRVNYDGTAPYSDTPINVFAALQNNYDASMSRNETVSAGYTKKAIDALTSLQGTPIGNQA
ncbi:hypothetical protein ACW9IO_10100 [Pseudomonas azotoformans]